MDSFSDPSVGYLCSRAFLCVCARFFFFLCVCYSVSLSETTFANF